MDIAIIKLRIEEVKKGDKINSIYMDDNLFYEDYENCTIDYDGPENYNFGEKMSQFVIKDYIATSDFLCCFAEDVIGYGVDEFGENIYKKIKSESGVNDFFEKSKEQIINNYKSNGSELFYKFIVKYRTYQDHNSYQGYETEDEIMPLQLINFKDVLDAIR